MGSLYEIVSSFYGNVKWMISSFRKGLKRALEGKSGKPKKMENYDWENIKLRWLNIIRPSIDDNIINNVNNEDTMPKLWEKIKKLYLEKILITKLNLKWELYRLKMYEGENIMDYISVFHGIMDQLKKFDVKIEEEDRALLFLTSPSDLYKKIVTTILYSKNTVKILEV